MALIAAGLISSAFPLSSSAMLLGELTVHSHLGQPLRASVPLKVDPDEELDSRCFSLAQPEKQSDHASYLTQASLELVETRGQFLLEIRSEQAIKEPFLRLLVQKNCGQGRVGKKFTVLLDPVEYAQIHIPKVKPAMAAESKILDMQDQYVARQGETLRFVAASLYPRQKRMQRNLLRAVRKANPELRDTSLDAPLPDGSVIQLPAPRPAISVPEPTVAAISKPRRARSKAKPPAEPVEQAQPAQPSEEGGFRLKLSSADLDMSMLGKMSQAQRQQLHEKQMLLDADDQVANTLSMKNRIMQLEEQIDGMQKALEQTNSRVSQGEKLAMPSTQELAPLPHDEWGNWLENLSFRGMAGGLLILALTVSAWWFWRRRQAEAKLEAELEQEFAASEMPQYPSPVPAPAAQQQVKENKPEATDQEDDFLSPVTSIFDREGESVTFTEAESVLDEADLYLAYGWTNRAIELLQEYMEKHPDDVSLWKKLFEIYSSQGMKQEFEQFALRCQSSMDDSSLWVLVQKLGRQLDAGNPLYFSNQDEREDSRLEPAAEAAAEPAEEAASEEVAVEPAEEVAVEQDKKSALDTPVEFVLDDEQLTQTEATEAAEEAKPSELDPLFPEISEKAPQLPENGKDDKKTS